MSGFTGYRLCFTNACGNRDVLDVSLCFGYGSVGGVGGSGSGSKHQGRSGGVVLSV